MRGTALLMLAAALVACGPERDLSGIWRLDTCSAAGNGEASTCPSDDFVYELHLGRFGDEVTGLLVQYVSRGGALNSFDKLNECGCHFLGSGSADGDAVHFEVDRLPFDGGRGCREPGAQAPSQCAADSPVVGPAACPRVDFDLRGDDEGIRGTIRCCRDADCEASLAFAVGFLPESGRPRTECVRCADR